MSNILSIIDFIIKTSFLNNLETLCYEDLNKECYVTSSIHGELTNIIIVGVNTQTKSSQAVHACLIVFL